MYFSLGITSKCFGCPERDPVRACLRGPKVFQEGHYIAQEQMPSGMADFSIAFYSDPPVASWVLPELLNSGLNISSIVTATPQVTRLDFPEDLKRQAEVRGISFFYPSSLSSPDFQKPFLRTKPSVIASMSFLRKVPAEILQAVPLGGINCHPALLPKYRGSVPCFWVILNRENVAGVTIHQMTDEFDAGDIHLNFKFPLGPFETSGTLLVRCSAFGVELMVKALKELEQGKSLPRIPQVPAQVTHAPLPDDSILEIRWDQEAAKVLALIRAASPIFGAFTLFRNLVIKIWSAHWSRPNDQGVLPGTLIGSQGKLEVATADSFIALEVIQMELMRFFSGQEFLAVQGIRDGEILGRHP